MKKLFTLFFALVATTALWAEDFSAGGIYYNILADKTNEVEVTYRGSNSYDYDNEYSGSVTIPSTLTYNGTTYSVTSIGDEAFDGCSGLTSITIPNSVTSIGERAFSGCSGLTSVTIPNSVTSIGDYAFYKCSSLTSVTIGNSVTSIGDGAFCYCPSLTSVTIPNSVTSIGNSAFEICYSLTSVTIGNSVMSIGERAFYDCLSLTSVVWNAKNCADFSSAPFYNISSYNNSSQITSFTFGDSVQHIPAYLCEGMNSLTSVTIGNSVTSIGHRAFDGCSSLPVENNLRYADTYLVGAVDKTLSTYSIKEGTKWIGDQAFYDCSGLKSVTIPNNVTSIGSSAFGRCFGLTSVTIGNSVTSIGSSAFYGCTGLTSVTIPNSVTSIGDGAFCECSGLTSVVVEEGNAVYDNRENCNAIIETASNTLLAGCKNTTIPNSVTTIGWNAFERCYGLTSVTIPNSVTSIGYYAFYGCSGLTSVTIGNSVTSIGWQAFYDCSSLTSVVWNIKNYADFSSYSSSPFYDIRSQITSFTFGDSVQHIPAYLCYAMSSLPSVTIPNSVTSIGDETFSGCAGLLEISLGSQVKTIGAEAFALCPRIYEVTCLAPEPPVAEESSFTNYDAYFHAPCDAQRYYSVDLVWKKFHNVECIVTENTVMDNITITPSDCEATVVWLSHEQAATYSLVITKQGETYCTLTFNKYGQLINIALAPARARAKQDAAEYTETSYSFTITGLDAATTYDYTFSVLNNAHETIDMHSGKFTTQSTTALENTHSQSPITNSQKLLRNGQLIIIRDGVEYNAVGSRL